MWVWILVGVFAYAGFMVLLLGILRAAGEADRRDRVIFGNWERSREPTRSGAPARTGRRSAA